MERGFAVSAIFVGLFLGGLIGGAVGDFLGRRCVSARQQKQKKRGKSPLVKASHPLKACARADLCNSKTFIRPVMNRRTDGQVDGQMELAGGDPRPTRPAPRR